MYLSTYTIHGNNILNPVLNINTNSCRVEEIAFVQELCYSSSTTISSSSNHFNTGKGIRSSLTSQRSVAISAEISAAASAATFPGLVQCTVRHCLSPAHTIIAHADVGTIQGQGLSASLLLWLHCLLLSAILSQPQPIQTRLIRPSSSSSGY